MSLEVSDQTLPQMDVAGEQARFITKVFTWMTVGLAVTAAISWFVAQSPTLIELFLNKWIFYGLLAVQLIEVIAFVALLKKVSARGAIGLFLLYAATVGLTFSIIFLVYTTGSILSIFAVTAGMFGGMALLGYTTKRDLTSLGSLLIMGLWGLILAQIVNLFIRNSVLDAVLASIGVLIFVGLTAYDVQKIKQTNILGDEGSEADTKQAVHGALELYLDFINLFLNLLRLFGKRN